jgi:transcriptional regulator with XRE-family HTH domain
MPQAAPMGTIGHALRAERRKRKIVQRIAAVQLSELHGEDIPQPTYGRWETGKAEPGGEYLRAIFEWTNTDEADRARMVLLTKLAKAGVLEAEAELWRSLISSAG